MAFFAANFIATTGRSRSAPLHVQAGFLPVQTKTHAKARRTLSLIGGTKAQLRGRDPIIAETIGAVGLILACLLPLLLAGYVLFTGSRNKDDSEMLNELLVTGIIDDELRLLSYGADNTARLEQQPVATIDDQSRRDGES